MIRGRSVRRATITGVRAAIFEVELTVPLGGEICQLAREIVDVFQNLCIVRYLANALERRRGDGLGNAICAEGRSVEPDVRHTDEIGLNVCR
jgi:hypothetical protein